MFDMTLGKALKPFTDASRRLQKLIEQRLIREEIISDELNTLEETKVNLLVKKADVEAERLQAQAILENLNNFLEGVQ